MNALSAGLVAVAVPASLAVVFGGMLDVAAIAFGLLWLVEAGRRVTGWARQRWTALPVPPVWAAPVAGASALGYAGIGAWEAGTGNRLGVIVFGGCTAGFAGVCAWAATARRRRRLRFPPLRDWVQQAVAWWRESRDARPRWSGEELAALNDETSLEGLLAALPRREGRRR